MEAASTCGYYDSLGEEAGEIETGPSESPKASSRRRRRRRTKSTYPCRICFSRVLEQAPDTKRLTSQEKRLISPCLCKGSQGFVHVFCLNQWRERSLDPNSLERCNSCLFCYKVQSHVPFLGMEFFLQVLSGVFLFLVSLLNGASFCQFSESLFWADVTLSKQLWPPLAHSLTQFGRAQVQERLTIVEWVLVGLGFSVVLIIFWLNHRFVRHYVLSMQGELRFEHVGMGDLPLDAKLAEKLEKLGLGTLDWLFSGLQREGMLMPFLAERVVYVQHFAISAIHGIKLSTVSTCLLFGGYGFFVGHITVLAEVLAAIAEVEALGPEGLAALAEADGGLVGQVSRRGALWEYHKFLISYDIVLFALVHMVFYPNFIHWVRNLWIVRRHDEFLEVTASDRAKNGTGCQAKV